MSDTARRPLLGRLAETPWLSRHGEVLAVQALAVLLEEPGLARAWSGLLEARTGVQVGPDLSWTAEATDRDAGRPDLVAAIEGQPVRVVVEAKFEHRISRGQVEDYLALLSRHPSRTQTCLLLLVPEHRRGEARGALETATSLADGPAVGVISWDEVIEALTTAARGGEADVDLTGDVWQLAGLCATYGARDVPPFTSQQLAAWPTRRPELETLVHRVSARLSQGRLYPLGREKDATGDVHGHYRRYISGDDGPSGATMSVGVRRPRQGWAGPFCIRYHRDTPGFQDALERLEQSDLPLTVAQRGHVYVPLTVPLGVSGTAVVDALVEQARRVHQVALGRVWPRGATRP